MRIAPISRTEYKNRSILDGYLFEEMLFFVRRWLGRCIAAVYDIKIARNLMVQRIVNDIVEMYDTHYYSTNTNFICKSITMMIPKWVIHYLRKSPGDYFATQQVALRYILTFSNPMNKSTLHEREFGIAFLSSWDRLFYRWYLELVQDEFLREYFTLFAVSRTKYFDHRYEEAIKRHGITQIIILGAGYDSRSYRYEELRRTQSNSFITSLSHILEDDKQLQLKLSKSTLLPSIHLQNDFISDPNPRHYRQLSLPRYSNDNDPEAHSIPQPCNDNRLSEQHVNGDVLEHPEGTTTTTTTTNGTTMYVPGSYVNVIEIDLPILQTRKAQLLVNHFGRHEAIRFSEGVVYAPCNLEDPLALKESLTGKHCNLSSNTLVILEDVLGYLSPEAVEGIFHTLHELWLTGLRATATYTYPPLFNQDIKDYDRLSIHDNGSPINHTSQHHDGIITTTSVTEPATMVLPVIWHVVFDFYTEIFLDTCTLPKTRAIRQLLWMIKSGFPSDKGALDAVLRSYGLRIRQLWDEETLARVYCPNNQFFEELGWSKLVDCEFSI